MAVEIIALIERKYGQIILEEMNSFPGVLQIFNAAGRSDDLFDNKQFGTLVKLQLLQLLLMTNKKKKSLIRFSIYVI